MLNFERVFVYLERRICMYLLKKEHFCQCTQFFVFIFVKERILLSMHQFLHHWLSSVNSEFGAMAAILFSFWCNFKTVPFGGIFRCHLRWTFCAIWCHFSVAFFWCHFLCLFSALWCHFPVAFFWWHFFVAIFWCHLVPFSLFSFLPNISYSASFTKWLGYFVWHFHCAVDIKRQRNAANKGNYLWGNASQLCCLNVQNQSENEAILVSIQRPQVSKGQRFSFAVKCWMLIILLILNIDDEY